MGLPSLRTICSPLGRSHVLLCPLRPFSALYYPPRASDNPCRTVRGFYLVSVQKTRLDERRCLFCYDWVWFLFISAVRVPGALWRRGVSEWQNTMWATSFPVFTLPTQAPGFENNLHPPELENAAELEKLVLERRGRGGGGFRGPRAPAAELFSSAKWLLVSQGCHLVVPSLGDGFLLRPPEQGPLQGWRSWDPLGRNSSCRRVGRRGGKSSPMPRALRALR